MVQDVKKSVINNTVNMILKTAAYSPDQAILAAIYLFQKFALSPIPSLALERVSIMVKEKHPGIVWARRLFKETNYSSGKKLISNLGLESLITTHNRADEYKAKFGFTPPWVIVISPSMRLNLRCIGCYAGAQSKNEELSFDEVDRVINEVKDMGVRSITISGGEPLSIPWLFDLARKHDNCYFLMFTNGTLIDKAMAKKIAVAGNIAPAISIEGGAEETDTRRGIGVYDKVMKAMDNLYDTGAMYGFSTTMTRYNTDVISADKFIEQMIAKGAKFGWFFQYIPIGKKPDINLMATAEQRNALRLQVERWRGIYPIFIGDFWNDGPFVCGCMAGGSKYLHINNRGDIEPCVFAQFAVDNIKRTTIKEALNSKFFQSIRDQQRTISNLYTPCCIIDHPEIMRQAVETGNAIPTYAGGDTILNDSKIKKHLDDYAKKIDRLTNDDWENYARENKNLLAKQEYQFAEKIYINTK